MFLPKRIGENVKVKCSRFIIACALPFISLNYQSNGERVPPLLRSQTLTGSKFQSVHLAADNTSYGDTLQNAAGIRTGLQRLYTLCILAKCNSSNLNKLRFRVLSIGKRILHEIYSVENSISHNYRYFYDIFPLQYLLFTLLVLF